MGRAVQVARDVWLDALVARVEGKEKALKKGVLPQWGVRKEYNRNEGAMRVCKESNCRNKNEI